MFSLPPLRSMPALLDSPWLPTVPALSSLPAWCAWPGAAAARWLPRGLGIGTALVLGLFLGLCVGAPAQAADEARDFSQAERLLFTSPQLKPLKLPTTLRYTFKRTGSLEPAFEDKVSVAVSAQPSGQCCVARGEFLSGPRRLSLPDVEGAEGNPVLMYFLEHDVREMQRLTKGSQGYFRKRVRMAFFNAASVREVRLTYRGKEVPGKEVLVSPYLDDPNRAKFERLARKEYRFLLSDAVPGGIAAIRAQVPADSAAAAPLLTDELLLDGVDSFKPAS